MDYFLVQILFFGRIFRAFLASVILIFFVIGQPWWPKLLLKPPLRKCLLRSCFENDN